MMRIKKNILPLWGRCPPKRNARRQTEGAFASLRTYVLASVLLLVPGCAQLGGIGDALWVTPQTPQQAVFEAEGHYLAAKTLAAKYMAQPPCAPAIASGSSPLPFASAGQPMAMAQSAPRPPFCSSASVVAAIEKTEIVVEESLAAAERTVTNPAFHWEKGSALPDAVIAAQNAATAFANIVHSTGVK